MKDLIDKGERDRILGEIERGMFKGPEIGMKDAKISKEGKDHLEEGVPDLQGRIGKVPTDIPKIVKTLQDGGHKDRIILLSGKEDVAEREEAMIGKKEARNVGRLTKLEGKKRERKRWKGRKNKKPRGSLNKLNNRKKNQSAKTVLY